jgi:Trafficking protein particle complex subunit 10, TRAPPC10
VKVDVPKNSEISAQHIQLNISTTYKYTGETVSALASETLQASFDETIAILDKSLLSIQSYDVISYSIDKVVVNALLRCNCPTTLTIKSWSIDLPSCYVLCNNGDMNESLTNEIIASGDRLSFTFDCTYVSKPMNGRNISDCILHVECENDVGTQFHESIKLRLKSKIEASLKYLDVKKPAKVTISTTVNESLVGTPVVFTYVIDVSEVIMELVNVTYRIATDHADWIISGRNVGIIDVSSKKQHDVTIVAIPIRPGPILDYPSLSLTCESATVINTIPISLIRPDPFSALSTSDHTSVAFLISSNTSKLPASFKVS